jgi:hypothetical protein
MSDFQGCTRLTQTSATNSINNLSSSAGKAFRLRMVAVSYSASTTQNITVTLTSGAGAAFNILLNTIAISSGTQGVYIPSTPIPFNSDDVITVSAPALASQTSSIVIYLDRLAA